MPEIWFPHLGIEIEKLNRIAITIFGYDMYWYGALIGFSLFLGTLLMMQEAKRTNQNPDTYVDIFLFALVFGFLGARLYYVMFSWEYYSQNLSKIFAIREGGLGLYGGLLGGGLTIYLFCKKNAIHFLQASDTILPSFIIGQIVGRWGNFINREAFGDYTDTLFAMRYPLADVRISDVSAYTMEHLVIAEGVAYIQVHPTFLYESVWNIGVFCFLLWVARNKKFHGQVTGCYCIGYGVGRFWIEGLRTDQLLIGTIPVSQLVSVMLVVGAVIFLWVRSKQPQQADSLPTLPTKSQEESQELEEEIVTQEEAEETETKES